jgi:hypothetical protein
MASTEPEVASGVRVRIVERSNEVLDNRNEEDRPMLCSTAVLGEFEDFGQNLLPICFFAFKGDRMKTTTTTRVIAGIILEGSEHNYTSCGDIVVRGDGEFVDESLPQIGSIIFS